MTDLKSAQRARQESEHRMIVHASMQAKRTGKVPTPTRSGGSQVATAVVVLTVVIGMLVLVFRQAG